MGVQQFTSTMKSFLTSDRYAAFLKDNGNTIINNTASSLRSSQQVAEKTAFNITRNDVSHMLTGIWGEDVHNVSNDIADKILAAIADNGKVAFSSKKSNVNKTGPIYSKVEVSSEGIPNVTYSAIGFDTISTVISKAFDQYGVGNTRLLKEHKAAKDEKFRKLEDDLFEIEIDRQQGIISKKSAEASKSLINTQISELDKLEAPTIGSFYHKGHLISVATNLVKQFKEVLESSIQVTKEAEKGKQLAVKVLTEYIVKLEKEDISTANFNTTSYDSSLVASYSKSAHSYVVQMQPGKENMSSGSASSPVLDQLKKLFNPTSVIPDLIKEANFLKSIIDTEGSPSYVSLIANSITDTLLGKSTSKTVHKGTANIPLPKKLVKQKVVSNKNVISNLKKAVTAIKNKKIVNTTEATLLKKYSSTAIRTTQGQFYSLANLQMLINSQLQNVISANMGNGDDRRILNYRTGRFAASANVERMSQSREGAITAYYSFMKNPYQTFQPGFAQGSPVSRDPKLLVSKSIREIAATKVGNRLRAVLV